MTPAAGDAGPGVAAQTAVLAALADPTRQQVLDLLGDDGPASASSLARRMPISRQAVVKHLRVLDEAGLVTSAPDGREVVYTIESEATLDAARWLERRATEWAARTDRLRQLAEDRRRGT